MPLDPQRTFTDLQKAEMFAKSGGKCQGPFCGGKPLKDSDRWHADHIIPWVLGGRTEVDNGQVLCPVCNLKKGAKMW